MAIICLNGVCKLEVVYESNVLELTDGEARFGNLRSAENIFGSQVFVL
jgi:hypothetical protein